jgi:mannosyltransferase
VTAVAIPSPRMATATRVVVALVALAAVLRLATLGQQSYWYDEAVTVHLVHDSFAGMLHRIPQSESTPPLYYVLAWVWARIAGTGEVGLRSLSALAGIATVPLLYLAGRRLAGQVAGLIAAGLAAVSPFLIWYAQEARAYALVVLLCAASLLLYLRAREHPTAGRLAACAAVSGAAVATHYFAVFVVVAEMALLLADTRYRARIRAVAAGAGVAVVVAALVPLALEQRATGRTNWIAHLPLGDRLGQLPLHFLAGFGEQAAPRLGLAFGLVVIAGALALLVRLAEPLRGDVARVLTIAAAGIAGPLVLALAGSDELLSRNEIVVWPALAVGFAALLAAPVNRRFGLVLAAAAAALGLAGTTAVVVESTLQRTDWRQAARLIGQTRTRRAIVAPGGFRALPLELYLHRSDPFPEGRLAVRQIVELGSSGGASGRCWWGAARCDLPDRDVRRRPPVPGFAFAGQARAGPFTVTRFQASRPQRVTGPQLGQRPKTRGGLLVLVDPAPAEAR